MIECIAVVKASERKSLSAGKPQVKVSLNFEQRQKSRYRTTTLGGEELSWFLPRAQVLSDGDCLQTKDGVLVSIVAAKETLSEVCCEDTLLLTKTAYHLGNRHVPLQILAGSLSYQHDHVLDAMVEGLGLSVNCVEKTFQPENGAYHESGGHGQDHSSSHSHSHKH